MPHVPYMQSDTDASAHVPPLMKSPQHCLMAVLGSEMSQPTSLQGQVSSVVAPMSISGHVILADADPEEGLKAVVPRLQPSEEENAE